MQDFLNDPVVGPALAKIVAALLGLLAAAASYAAVQLAGKFSAEAKKLVAEKRLANQGEFDDIVKTGADWAINQVGLNSVDPAQPLSIDHPAVIAAAEYIQDKKPDLVKELIKTPPAGDASPPDRKLREAVIARMPAQAILLGTQLNALDPLGAQASVAVPAKAGKQ